MNSYENKILEAVEIIANQKIDEADFNKTVQGLMAKDKEHYAPRITQIIENHLGIGKKVAECSRNQAPVIEIILSEIKDLD